MSRESSSYQMATRLRREVSQHDPRDAYARRGCGLSQMSEHADTMWGFLDNNAHGAFTASRWCLVKSGDTISVSAGFLNFGTCGKKNLSEATNALLRLARLSCSFASLRIQGRCHGVKCHMSGGRNSTLIPSTSLGCCNDPPANS